MSGSKLLRLCCLFLSLLLLVPSFSVVANAAEAEENLVDSDLQNWDLISEHDTWGVDNNKIFDMSVHYSQSRYNISLDGNTTGIPIESDMYGGFCELTNLIVGENYSFSIDFSAPVTNFNDYYSCYIGLCYYTSDGVFYPYDGVEMLYCPVSTTFTNHKLDFTYSYNGHKPYIFIIVECEKTNRNAWWLYAKNISLTRLPSETEKKLDGILGWLEDIKNSIVGLPETIKTNFSTFFSNLQDKITEMKDGVTEKLGTISTEFSGYITGLGDRVSSFFTDLKENISAYFTDLWNKFSEFFEKFKPRINVDFNFKSGALNTSTGEFEYPAGNSYVLSDVIYIPEGVEMHLNYTTVNSVGLKYIPVTSDGEYAGRYDQYFSDFELLLNTSRYFIIETRSYSAGGLEGYVDVGWFTYFTYTLRHKIDIKIEEIKTSIHDFFVPPEGFFEEWKDKFDLMLSDNLGFVYQAPNFVIQVIYCIQDVLNTKTEPELVFPKIEFDIVGYHVLLFEDAKVDFSFLDTGIWSILYGMYKVMVHAILIFALIKLAQDTWERTMEN